MKLVQPRRRDPQGQNPGKDPALDRSGLTQPAVKNLGDLGSVRRFSDLRLRLRTRLPSLWRFYMFAKRACFALSHPTRRLRFEAIARRNKWRNDESISGFGSTTVGTKPIREALVGMINALEVTDILDIPCGDFHWMRQVDLGIRYVGADIADAIIRPLQQAHAGDEMITFRRLDIVTDALPQSDLVFTRECFNHFSFRSIRAAIANVRSSKSRLIALTHYPHHMSNSNQETGYTYRPLNFTLHPFCWPEPLLHLAEASPDGRVMAVWEVSALPST